MDLGSLWNKLVGKPADDAYLLAQERERLAKLQEATRIAKEKAEVHRQLLVARKEVKELEEGLGRRRGRLVVYIVVFGVLLVVILLARSCMAC